MESVKQARADEQQRDRQLSVRLGGLVVLDVQTNKVAVTRDVRGGEQLQTVAAMLAGQGGGADLLGFDEEMDRVTFANELKFSQRMSIEEHAAKKDDDSEQLRQDTIILTRGTATTVSA
jgi:hypothetical protein